MTLESGNFNTGQPKPENEAEKQDRIRDKITFPHIEALRKIFEKEKIDVDYEAVSEMVIDVFEQIIENTQIYNSEKLKAAFPWTCIDTSELAKKLYAKYVGHEPETTEGSAEQDEKQESQEKKIFVFGSTPQGTRGGSIFGFAEELLHLAVKGLPSAIEKLKKGENPETTKIYNLGFPTNELGSMSQEFVDSMKGNKAFEQFGSLYSEFIATTLPKEGGVENESGVSIDFQGISMGASFAAETAKNLIEENLATQSREESEEDHKPFLTVRLDTPPGPSDTPKGVRKIMTKPAFVADAFLSFATDSYLRDVMSKDGEFLDQVNGVLAERGINTNLSPQQVELKERGISEIIENFEEGVPLPENLRVTEVIGMYDPLMYSGKFNRNVAEQKAEHAGSIGQNLVSKNENRRQFGVKMRHAIPWFRENELKRLAHTAKILKGLEK